MYDAVIDSRGLNNADYTRIQSALNSLGANAQRLLVKESTDENNASSFNGVDQYYSLVSKNLLNADGSIAYTAVNMLDLSGGAIIERVKLSDEGITTVGLPDGIKTAIKITLNNSVDTVSHVSINTLANTNKHFASYYILSNNWSGGTVFPRLIDTYSGGTESDKILVTPNSSWQRCSSSIIPVADLDGTIRVKSSTIVSSGTVLYVTCFQMVEESSLTDYDLNSLFSFGDQTFFVSGWVKPSLSTPVGNDYVCGRLESTGNKLEWGLYQNTSRKWVFRTSADGAAVVDLPFTAINTIANNWYFVFAYFDSVNNQVGISVDGSSIETLAQTEIFQSSGAVTDMEIGSIDGGANFFNGIIDSLTLGCVANGLDTNLYSFEDIRDFFYNQGFGKKASDLTINQKRDLGLIAFFDFDNVSGNTTESINSIEFTNNNSIPSVRGYTKSPYDNTALKLDGSTAYLKKTAKNLLNADDSILYASIGSWIDDSGHTVERVSLTTEGLSTDGLPAGITHALKITWSGSSGSYGPMVHTLANINKHFLSCYMLSGSVWGGGPVTTDFISFTSSTESDKVSATPNNTTWQRVSKSIVADAGDLTGLLGLNVETTDPDAGNVLYVTCFQMVEESSLTDYDRNSLFSFGDQDFFISVFAKNISNLSTEDWVLARAGEFRIRISGGNIQFVCFGKTVSDSIVSDAWEHLYCYYDKTNDLIGIIVDNGTAVTASTPTPTQVATDSISIGARDDGTTLWEGNIDQVLFGCSANGLDFTVNSPAVIANRLYNSGNGLKSVELIGTEFNTYGIVESFDLDEESDKPRIGYFNQIVMSPYGSVSHGAGVTGITLSNDNTGLEIEPGSVIDGNIVIDGSECEITIGNGCTINGLIIINGDSNVVECENGLQAKGLKITGDNNYFDGGGWDSLIDGGIINDAVLITGTDNIISKFSCKTTSGGASNFDGIRLDATAHRNIISLVQIKESDRNGININNPTDCIITGCEGLQADANGTNANFFITGQRTLITGCHIAGSDGIGINLETNSDNSVIHGCVIETCTANEIEVEAGAEDCIIYGNRVVAGTINDLSGTSTVADNDLT